MYYMEDIGGYPFSDIYIRVSEPGVIHVRFQRRRVVDALLPTMRKLLLGTAVKGLHVCRDMYGSLTYKNCKCPCCREMRGVRNIVLYCQFAFVPVEWDFGHNSASNMLKIQKMVKVLCAPYTFLSLFYFDFAIDSETIFAYRYMYGVYLLTRIRVLQRWWRRVLVKRTYVRFIFGMGLLRL